MVLRSENLTKARTMHFVECDHYLQTVKKLQPYFFSGIAVGGGICDDEIHNSKLRLHIIRKIESLGNSRADFSNILKRSKNPPNLSKIQKGGSKMT